MKQTTPKKIMFSLRLRREIPKSRAQEIARKVRQARRCELKKRVEKANAKRMNLQNQNLQNHFDNQGFEADSDSDLENEEEIQVLCKEIGLRYVARSK